MPRNTERPLNADEQRFIRHYVRERDLEKAERKARLKSGQGVQFYRRKEVRADIDRRIGMIELEQAKIDAQDIARREETLSELLDPELCKAIKLDAEKHGATKLNAIRLGLVVSGRIRQGNTEALDRGADTTRTSVSIYESVFTRRHSEDAAASSQPLASAPAKNLAAAVKPPATQAPQHPPPPPPSRTPSKTVIRVY